MTTCERRTQIEATDGACPCPLHVAPCQLHPGLLRSFCRPLAGQLRTAVARRPSAPPVPTCAACDATHLSTYVLAKLCSKAWAPTNPEPPSGCTCRLYLFFPILVSQSDWACGLCLVTHSFFPILVSRSDLYLRHGQVVPQVHAPKGALHAAGGGGVVAGLGSHHRAGCCMGWDWGGGRDGGQSSRPGHYAHDP